MFGVDLPFEVILIAFIILMLQPTLRSFCEGLIEWLVKATKIEILGFKINVIGPLTDLVQVISHYLGKMYAQVQQYPVALMTAFIRYFDFITKATFAISWELERFAKYVVGVAIPDAITTARAGLAAPVHGITKIVRVLPGRMITTLPKALQGKIGAINWVYEHIKALQRLITTAGATKVDSILPRVERLLAVTEADIKALTKRLTGSAHGLIAGTAAGVVVLGLERAGLNWIRCNNWGKLGRAGCRTPWNSIENLLSLITDVLIFEDVCQVIPLLETGLAQVAGPLGTITGTLGGALCHGDFTAGEPLTTPQLYLPATQTLAV